MVLPSKAGRYIASPHQWAIGEYDGKPTLDMVFTLLQYFNGSVWEPIDGDVSITKKFFLMKNDGTWSKVIVSLVESLGWDGASLRGLQSGDWSQVEVQLTIDYDEKEGKRYIGVKFINPRDWEGTSITSDPVVVQSLEAKYGALLRQKTGAKLNGNQPAKKTAAQQILSPKTVEEAKTVAWREFKSKAGDLSDDDRKTVFLETIEKYSNGKDYRTLTINDWNVVSNQIAEFGIYRKPEPATVGDAPSDGELKDDDLPF